MILAPEVKFYSLPLPLHEKSARELRASGITLPETLKEAHPGRQEKFLAGRYCAYLALKAAGLSTPPKIPISSDGSPLWPLGFIGSITHTEGQVSAAVAPTEKILGIGIDTELLMTAKTLERVAPRILIGKEIKELRPSDYSEIEWATLVFSAKESIYKCLRPLTGQYFGFEAAELDEVDLKQNIFRFHLTKDIGANFKQGWEGEGQFEKVEKWIRTAMVLRN